MVVLLKPISFEWDKGNLRKNVEKHKVTVQEAEELFSNEPFVVEKDVKHSTSYEQRYQALGRTRSGRKLFTSFTIRIDKIRIISVRDMSKKEEVEYEKIEKNS